MFDIKKILDEAIKPFKTRIEAVEKQSAETNSIVKENNALLKQLVAEKK